MKINENDKSFTGLCEITGNSTMLSPKTPLQTSTPYVSRILKQTNDDGFVCASGKNIKIDMSKISNYKQRFDQEEMKMKITKLDETSLCEKTPESRTLNSPNTPTTSKTKAIELPGPSDILSTQYDVLIDYDLIDQVNE